MTESGKILTEDYGAEPYGTGLEDGVDERTVLRFAESEDRRATIIVEDE